MLLYCTIAFGQPTVDIPLIATEATVQTMSVGLDLTATNCIDVTLGEAEAPPAPPPGSFHIVFDLDPYGCPGITTWKDYRNAPSFPFTGPVQHTLIWQRSASGTAITIQYDLPNGAAMTIQDQFGGVLLNLGPFTGSGTTVIPGSYSINSAFLIMQYTDVTPVELTSFTASVSDGGVLLNWSTATELNNQGFDIERLSNSEGNWEKIGYIPGFGTTTEQKNYSYLDGNVTTGSYSYRLKQIDFDGTFEYSNEIVVEVDLTPTDYNLSQNYPNPFNPTTTIEFSIPENTKNVRLTIYNALGERVAELINGSFEPGYYKYQWDAVNLNSGFYLYELRTEKFVSVKKMMHLK